MYASCTPASHSQARVDRDFFVHGAGCGTRTGQLNNCSQCMFPQPAGGQGHRVITIDYRESTDYGHDDARNLPRYMG
jgi:hypothetical protein